MQNPHDRLDYGKCVAANHPRDLSLFISCEAAQQVNSDDIQHDWKKVWK